MTVFAVVAAGGMGSGIGARLVARGATVLTSLEGRSPATVARAEKAGMQGAGMEALAKAEVILSVVPPNQALPLARSFSAAMRAAGQEGGTTPLYVDLNAINPATSREVAACFADGPGRFVDGSIIGGPPKGEDAGPSLYLSGADAGAAAAAIGGFGLVTKVLAGDPTAASALKMSYAGLTKGFTALGVAMILAATRQGAADALFAELGESQKEMLARLGRGIPDMLPKAYRWVPEMREIAGFIGPEDPAAGIYRAVADLYEAIARDQAGDGAVSKELLAFVQKAGRAGG